MNKEKKLSAGETAAMFSIAASTLRYYESEGLLDPVKRSESGRREYGEKEFRRIRFVLMLREAGIPVEEIKKYVALFHEGVSTIPERKQILNEQLIRLKEEVVRMNAVISALEDMVENYDSTIMKRELDSRQKDPEYGKL